MKITHIPPGAIIPSASLFQKQRRAERTEQQRAEMAESIRNRGIQQPLLVRELPQGFTPDLSDPTHAHAEPFHTQFYECIAGEGRLLGAITVDLEEIPSIVKENLSDKEALELQLLENLQRNTVSPLAEATGYDEMINSLGHSVQDIQDAFGFSERTIRMTMRLVNLTEPERHALTEHRISKRVAAELVTITDAAERARLFERVSQDDVSQQVGLGMISQTRKFEEARQAWEAQEDQIRAYFPNAEVILNFNESIDNFEAGSEAPKWDSSYRLYDELIPDGAIRKAGIEHGTTWGQLADLIDHQPVIIRNGQGAAVQVVKAAIIDQAAALSQSQGETYDVITTTEEGDTVTVRKTGAEIHQDETDNGNPDIHHLPTPDTQNPAETTAFPDPRTNAAEFPSQWLAGFLDHSKNVPFELYRDCIARMVPAAWTEAIELCESPDEINWALLGAHLESLSKTHPETNMAAILEPIWK
jgi:ParB/RepB/Spo0J family partition protein